MNHGGIFRSIFRNCPLNDIPCLIITIMDMQRNNKTCFASFELSDGEYTLLEQKLQELIEEKCVDLYQS
jgi:hypothetical protein